jgi:cell shape-determining protein MreC
MSKERIVEDLANTVVVNEENNFKAARIALGKVFQKMGDSDKLQNELDELKKENERTSPLPYDEEEIILYNAYGRKKK